MSTQEASTLFGLESSGAQPPDPQIQAVTDPIFVTQPSLPPLEELVPYLEQIWESRQLTNNGPFHQQLEQRLREYLGLDEVALFANGTLALVTALQALRITGEVITTPFSFVATAHSLRWNGLEPVFADIEAGSLNLDPDAIEAAVTPRTSAILPVHVYGRPCDTGRIQAVADRHGLKVIYDAAHAFGVEDDGGSLLRHGDLSIQSFHATKVFTTFEGGAIACRDAEMKRHVDHLKNFGFVDETTVVASGINGKMNEFQAAVGLLQLRHVDAALARRKLIDDRYRAALHGIPGITIPPAPPSRRHNYAYFPIFVEPGCRRSRDELYFGLQERGIFGRRYFYPLISDMPMYQQFRRQPAELPVARRIAEQVICLPIHPGLTDTQVDHVAGSVLDLCASPA